MHKEGGCANNWTKISLNLGAKAMFFSKTRRTLPKPRKTIQPCLEMAATTKPRNGHFLLLKHVSFIQANHNIIHKHVWIIKTNKKHQNQAKDTKSKKT